MVGDDIVLGSSFGGGVGFGAGFGTDGGVIVANRPGRFNAAGIQNGSGWSFSISLGPLSYSRSGDGDGARWNGETHNIQGFEPQAAMQKANYLALYQAILSKSLSSLKGKASVNYQNTKSSVWQQW